MVPGQGWQARPDSCHWTTLLCSQEAWGCHHWWQMVPLSHENCVALSLSFYGSQWRGFSKLPLYRKSLSTFKLVKDIITSCTPIQCHLDHRIFPIQSSHLLVQKCSLDKDVFYTLTTQETKYSPSLLCGIYYMDYNWAWKVTIKDKDSHHQLYFPFSKC